MTGDRPGLPPGRDALLLPLLALGAGLLLHVDRLPWWCSLACALALAWRWRQGLRPLAAAARPLHRRGLDALPTLAAALLMAAVLFSFRTFNGLTAGTALLAAMAASKLLETRQSRDLKVLLGVAVVLVLAACLDRQDLVRLPLYAVATWLALAGFAALGARPGGAAGVLPWREALRASGRSLRLALPLAAVAFVLFPRLSLSLWTLPGDSGATSGLGNEMSPGSINDLSLSDEIAFRVRFDGPAPAPAERYWRGPVLHEFDGHTWRQRPFLLAPSTTLEFRGPPVRQNITLEPTQRPWWFALDTVVASPEPAVRLAFDRQLVGFRPVTRTQQYSVTSHVASFDAAPLPALLRRLDLQLPTGRNPRSSELARQWRAEAATDGAFVQRALAYLREGGFRYTLSPPLLGADAVDELLFSTRLGFCGHYASAFTHLMRAGGVPARVVTGYHGGEWNPLGEYYVIRQADAHAWTEVWLEGRGWTRIDPTAVVQPERLTVGLRELLPDSGGTTARFLRDARWLRELGQAWDAGNQWWRDSVMGLRLQDQLSLLQRLGLPAADYRYLVGLLAATGLLWLAWLLWQLRRERGTPEPTAPDALGRRWQDLRRALQSVGVASADGRTGPLALRDEACALWPELREGLQDCVEEYVALRYGPAATEPTASGIDPARQARWLRSAQALQRALQRRARWLASLQPMPAAQQDLLADVLPLWHRLPTALRGRIAAMAWELSRRLRFEGCNGLQVTDTMRLVIAFQASLLVARQGTGAYEGLRTVLVYPDAFVVTQRFEDESGVVTEGEDVLAGQSIDTSRIVLSWADVEEDLQRDDGCNVVLHEFAHLLDHAADGVLSQRDGSQPSRWHDAWEAAYEALCDAIDAGEDTLVDPYGSEDPAEFFAVCTEAFIGLPQEFQARHADLYDLLRRGYGLDPATWDAATSVG